MTPGEIRDLLAGAADRYRNVRASIVYTLRRPGSRRIVNERRVVYERPGKAVQEEWRLTPTVHRLQARHGSHRDRTWAQAIGRKRVDVHRIGEPAEGPGHPDVLHPEVVELLDPSRIVHIEQTPILEDRGETTCLDRTALRIGVSVAAADAIEVLPWGDGELLVDTERGVVLRAEDAGPDGATMTSEVTEIAFDLDLPPETFEPPAGSEVVEWGPDDEGP